MPKLPSPDDMSRQSPRPTRGATSGGPVVQGLASATSGLARYANVSQQGFEALGEAAGIIQEHRDRLALSSAEAEITKADIEARSLLDKPPGEGQDPLSYEDYLPAYRKELNTRRSEISKELPAHLRPIFSTRVKDTLARGEAAVREKAHKKWRLEQRGYLDAKEVEYKSLASNPETTSSQRASILAGYSVMLQAARDLEVLTPEEVVSKKHEMSVHVATSSVLTWFKAQEDPVVAAEMLYRGEIDDEPTAQMLGILSTKDRQAVMGEAIDGLNKVLALRERVRDDEERQIKEADEMKMSEFFFSDQMSTEGRLTAWESLRYSPHLTVSQKQLMQEYIEEGPPAFDVEEDVLAAERALGETIINEQTLVSEIAENGWKISPATLRTRLRPQLEAVQDRDFYRALEEGQAALGYDKNSSINEFMKDPFDRAMQLKAEMFAYRRNKLNKPDYDPIKFMTERVEQLRSRAGEAALRNLRITVERYRELAARGLNPDDPEVETVLKRLRTLAGAPPIGAGIVSEIDLMDPNFDIIDAVEGHFQRLREERGGNANPR